MGKAQAVMDEDLAGLSEEEREALKVDEAEVAALKAVAGEDQDDEPGDDQESTDQDKGDEKGEGMAHDAQPEDDDQPFVPRYAVQEPENYDARMQELAEKRAQVVAQYKEGALELDEMLSQVEALDQQRTDLRLAKEKADLLKEQNEQNAEQLWQWEIQRFMRNVKRAEGIDYTDPILNAALDVAVKDLANKPEHADKDGEWFLTTAHSLVKQKFGLGTKEDKDKSKEDPVKKAVEERKPDLKAVPKNVGDLPRAGNEPTGEDEFAYLDKLEGIELEQALAKLPKDQVERYLTGR